MGFSNPIIGGISNLIRAAIRSPNFVTGLTGWSINRDGTAEFNNAIIRGLLQAGSIIAGSISQATIGSSILVGDQLFDCDYIIDDSGGTILIYSLAGQTVVGISATGDGTFNVPAGVTTLKVECWGAGGGGNGSYAAPGSNIVGGGGGSGAEYAAEPNYPVTPLAALNYHVGVGGAGGTGRTALPQTPIIGGVGENTTFDLAGVGVTAHGAGGGMLGAVPGGTGSTNTVHFDGGAKAGGSAFNSGAGGGSSGGPSRIGNNGKYASSNTVPGAGGAGFTDAGAGGSGGGQNAVGVVGSAPGGGGGGGGGLAGSSAKNGGSGARGQIRISYGPRVLVASFAGVAGTDQYGNAYPAGINLGGPISWGNAFPGLQLEEEYHRAAAQNILDNTVTTVIFDTQDQINSGYGAPTYNTTTGLWTAPDDGYYILNAQIGFNAFANPSARVFAGFSDGTNAIGRQETDAIAATDPTFTPTFAGWLAKNTVVHVEVYQHSLATVGLRIATGNNFRVKRIL